MSVSKYNDFHLLIKDAEIIATYIKRGANNEIKKLSKSASSHFEFKNYYNLIKAIEDEDISTENPNSYKKEHLDLGKTLFSFLFPKDIDQFFHDCYIDSKDKDGKTGLRIRLEINHNILSNVAWEFAYDEILNTYLCTEVTTPFTRYYGGVDNLISRLDKDEEEEIEGGIISIKALFISSNALGDEFIDPEKEYQMIDESISQIKGNIKIDKEKAKPPSWDKVHDELFDNVYNIVHFYGHGVFMGEKVHLIFESSNGKRTGDPIDPDRFAALFDRRKSKELCLILINACQGAKTSEANPRSGLAHNLVMNSLNRVNAVIAMQFPIAADAAGSFAQKLYGYIAKGNAIDEAIQIARQFLYGSLEYNKLRFFATPVLFLTSHTGYIFNRLMTIQKPPSPDDAKEMIEALDNNYDTLLKSWNVDRDIKLDEFWAFENKGNLLNCLRFFQKLADTFNLTEEQEKKINQWLTDIPLKLRLLRNAESSYDGNRVTNLEKEILDLYGHAQNLLRNLFKKYGNEARFRNASSKLQVGVSNSSISKIDAILQFYNMIDDMIYVKSLVSKCYGYRQKQDVLSLIAEGYQKPIADFRIRFDKWMSDLESIPLLQTKMTNYQKSLAKKLADLDGCFTNITSEIDSINGIMNELIDEFKELWKLTITTMVKDEIRVIQ